MEHKRALALFTLFSEIDAATGELAAATGLHCPAECGQCCESPKVHTNPAELAPLAEHLMAAGTAEAALELALAAGPGACIFYRASGAGTGRCSVYAWRPSVCRLFGFAAVRGKHGTPELAACKVHRAVMPEAVERAQALVVEGHPVPLFVEYQQRAAEAADSPMAQLLPINVAAAQALERALARAAFASAAAQSPEHACTRPRSRTTTARTPRSRVRPTRLFGGRLAAAANRPVSRSAWNARRPRRR